MGRKKVRKRDRRQEQRTRMRGGELRETDYSWMDADSQLAWGLLDREREQAATEIKTCSTCREFILDPDEGGRGECTHPASGVMSPWTDTPACPFYDSIYRRR